MIQNNKLNYAYNIKSYFSILIFFICAMQNGVENYQLNITSPVNYFISSYSIFCKRKSFFNGLL